MKKLLTAALMALILTGCSTGVTETSTPPPKGDASGGLQDVKIQHWKEPGWDCLVATHDRWSSSNGSVSGSVGLWCKP